MLFKVNNYIFDSQRLIFYPSCVSQGDMKVINSVVLANDNYAELSSELCKLDADNLNARYSLPTTVGICLTYKCQLKCNYCSFESEKDGMELDVQTIHTFINFLIRNILIKKISTKKVDPLTIYFTGGGEPTLNWALFVETVEYIINKCKEKGIVYYLHLTTNGILNEEQVKYLANNFSSIMVSFDGSPSVQNTNRKLGGGLETSQIVSKTLFKLDQLDALYTIRTTIWQHDFDRINEMVDYIYGNFKNIKGWSISPILVTGRALKNTNDEYFDEKRYNFIKSFVSAADYAKKTYGANNMSIKLFPNSKTDILCGSCYIANPWLMPDKTICTCLEGKTNIPVVGYVNNGRVVLLEKYEDKLLKEYRKRFISKNCNECIAFRFCRSGCPLKFIADEYSGKKSSSWICNMTRFYWTYVFQHILNGEETFGWSLKKINDTRIKDLLVYELIRK